MDKVYKRMIIATFSLLVIIAGIFITSANNNRLICITEGIDGINFTKLDNESSNNLSAICTAKISESCREKRCQCLSVCVGLDDILTIFNMLLNQILTLLQSYSRAHMFLLVLKGVIYTLHSRIPYYYLAMVAEKV